MYYIILKVTAVKQNIIIVEIFMSEEKIEWRDAWKKLIDASREMIQNGDKNNTEPFDNLRKLQDDKMLLFEKAIAYECLGNNQKAKELYIKASDEKEGLPVEHWRKRAKYFLDRLEKNGNVCIDNLSINSLNTNQSVENVQWDLYYNIHFYSNIDDYIRYLAISSVSRVHSEPAMAIVIFRTCLEIALWTYFEKDAEEINTLYRTANNKDPGYEISLSYLLKQLNNRKIFTSRKEYNTYYDLKEYGDKAAHPGKIKEEPPFKYSDDELIQILECFNKTLFYLNEHAKNHLL